MELTTAQKNNLVIALKEFRKSKFQYETAQKNMAMKLEKLKECCGGSGAEPQILATTYELLANIALKMDDEPKY